jgi:hypothetical protein
MMIQSIISDIRCHPPPPHAHVRLSLALEPASTTERGSGERDACPSIHVCFCLGALSYAVTSRGTHTYSFLFVRGHSTLVPTIFFLGANTAMQFIQL